MSTENNKALIKSFYEKALNSDNLDRLEDYLADDYVSHSRLKDRQGIRKALADHRKAYASVKFIIEDMIAEGDKVVVRSTVELQSKDGSDKTVSEIDIHRISGNQIVESWVHSDFFY